ncbi:MAG: GntR family transcriptional regulator [Pirellulales bacterium]
MAQTLIEQIESGEYAPGAKLPTYRELMRQHDLTSGTVSYAMSILAEQGHVAKRHGSGVFALSPGASVSDTNTGESLGWSSKPSSGLIALVVPEIKSGLYLSLQAGMEKSSRERSEQLITVTTGADVGQQADVLIQLLDRGVAGIAMVPPYSSVPPHHLRMLQKQNIPLVLLHRGVPGIHAPVISIPFEDIGRLAGQALVKQGHQHVAIALGQRSDVGDSYLRGFRAGLKLGRIELPDEYVMWPDHPLITAQDCADKLEFFKDSLGRMKHTADRPTAIFATFDRIGELAYLAAIQVGLSVPGDLSLICFGDKHRVGAILPRLSTIAVDEFETGRKACELLAGMQIGSRSMLSDEVIEVSVSLDPAETLGPPPTG